MKSEHELQNEERQAAQPKYTVDMWVWYHANWQRHEGRIEETRQRGTHFFYRIGTDWVPEEQLTLAD